MFNGITRIAMIVALLFAAGEGEIYSQDISSGGLPTITGNSGGSVTGSSSNTVDLSVTINFGEVSPANTNSIVKVIVPIAIRSVNPYRVNAVVSGGTNVNLQAIQRSDIGFGVENVRRTGGLFSRSCNVNSHTIYSPFDDDPADNVSFAASGRVVYPASIGNLATSTTILSGPAPSFLLGGRFDGNEWTFDAVFAITPQFYSAGNATATVTFTISAGPNVAC